MKNTGLFLLSSAVLFLISCDFFSSSTNYFSEYNGVNLLSTGTDFSAWLWTEDGDPSSTSTKEESDTFVYASFTETADSGVYEFTIPNLFKDGDFEASSVGNITATEGGVSGTWFKEDSDIGSTFEIANYTSTASNPIMSGKALYYDINDSDNNEDYTGVKLSQYLLNGINVNKTYTFLFNYFTSGSPQILFQLIADDLINPSFDIDKHSWITDSDGTSEYTVPTDYMKEQASYDETSFTPLNSGEYFLVFGEKEIPLAKTGGQEAYIDNIRVLRTDLEYKVQLEISESTTVTLPLVSGYYKFSADFKLSDSIGNNNDFHMSSITMEILQPNESGSYFTAQPVISEQKSFDSLNNTDWTTLSVSMSEDNIQIEAQSSTTTPILYLNIGADLTAPSVGTIQIKNPQLFFSSSPF